MAAKQDVHVHVHVSHTLHAIRPEEQRPCACGPFHPTNGMHKGGGGRGGMPRHHHQHRHPAARARCCLAATAHRIAGGLAWLGFLAVGSLGEQVKTRMEVDAELAGTKWVGRGGRLRGREGRGAGSPPCLPALLPACEYCAIGYVQTRGP